MPWRGAKFKGEYPTLGHEILEWTYEFLPSPADETQPLVFTPSQAEKVLRWFRLDAFTGEFASETLVLEEAKGSGKSPFAGVLALIELVGPCLFAGWDTAGEPVGVRWGTGDRPSPHGQIAAVSEDQTENTYGAMYSMLRANDGKAADALHIDAGLTRLFLTDRPGRLDPVTASAGSREGQRVTSAVLDETHLWLRPNGGQKLARVIRRNVAKMGGRTIETTNAPILGERSVAESRDPDNPGKHTLHYARRPEVEPDPTWTDARLKRTLAQVYGDAWWVDPARLLREVRDPKSGWAESLQFWFNVRSAGTNAAVDPRRWAELRAITDVQPGARIGLGFEGSTSSSAAALRGCTPEGHSFLIAAWAKPAGTSRWEVPRQAVTDAVTEAFATFKVGLMLCDEPGWRSEIESWAETFGDEVVLGFPTSRPQRFAPAVDRWLTALREGTHTHDGDPTTDDHVRAAHLRKVRVTDPDDDGRTLYVLVRGAEGGQVAACVADVLALEAAQTMTETKPREFAIAFT